MSQKSIFKNVSKLTRISGTWVGLALGLLALLSIIFY